MTEETLYKSMSPLRILVADDNEAMAKTFGWMLEALGHEVRVVYDGLGAVDAAESFLPDVVMLDITLPGMSGYEACKKLRMTPGLEKSLFIAQTGWSQPEHFERSREAGFHHHLVKPVTVEHLAELLATLTDKRAA